MICCIRRAGANPTNGCLSGVRTPRLRVLPPAASQVGYSRSQVFLRPTLAIVGVSREQSNARAVHSSALSAVAASQRCIGEQRELQNYRRYRIPEFQ